MGFNTTSLAVMVLVILVVLCPVDSSASTWVSHAHIAPLSQDLEDEPQIEVSDVVTATVPVETVTHSVSVEQLTLGTEGRIGAGALARTTPEDEGVALEQDVEGTVVTEGLYTEVQLEDGSRHWFWRGSGNSGDALIYLIRPDQLAESLSPAAQQRVERARASRVRQTEDFPVSFSMKEALIEAAPWMTDEQMERYEVFVTIGVKDLPDHWFSSYVFNQGGQVYFKVDVDFIKNSARWCGVEEAVFSDPVVLRWWTLGAVFHEGDHVLFKGERGVPLDHKFDRHEIEPPAYAQQAAFLGQAASYERSRGNEEASERLEELVAKINANVARGHY